jgi:hypothetical protein
MMHYKIQRLNIGILLFVLGLAWVWSLPSRSYSHDTQPGAGLPLDELRARRFVIVDSTGKNRAELGLLSEDCSASVGNGVLPRWR